MGSGGEQGSRGDDSEEDEPVAGAAGRSPTFSFPGSIDVVRAAAAIAPPLHTVQPRHLVRRVSAGLLLCPPRPLERRHISASAGLVLCPLGSRAPLFSALLPL